MAISEADVIVVGGGLTGCAIASRIKQGNAALEVAAIEAGPDPTGDPRVTTPMGGFALAMSELDWAYMTEPQIHTNGRRHYCPAGKTLGGGSVLNYAGWSRGDATDFEEWARLVGDSRWNYAGLLPYFKKSEHYTNDITAGVDKEQHGFDGPMHYTSVAQSDPDRKYGLRDAVKEAWTEMGVPFNPDTNSGNLMGLSEVDENWHDGQRQPSYLAYSLKGVHVITGSLVQKVVISSSDGSKPRAVGVVLADGTEIKARKEVILSSGAHRTPQILMLSGVGPKEQLAKHNIPLIQESPEVGRNLFDHFALFQWWKLRASDQGLALGTPQWTSPAFFKGLPTDWAIREHVPSSVLDKAIALDGLDAARAKVLSDPAVPHYETMVTYAAGPSQVIGLNLPMDGTYVCTCTMLTVPTSRGSITLVSDKVTDKPIIDPNYYATAVDRAALIHGTRRTIQSMLSTKAGKKYVESEVLPPGASGALNSESSDAEIDARIRLAGFSHAHTSGSASMGKVVDTKLRVIGVEGLRVADASVLPTAISAHPQATLYALAEAAADLVLQDLK